MDIHTYRANASLATPELAAQIDKAIASLLLAHCTTPVNSKPLF
jgi:hypothetical protein